MATIGRYFGWLIGHEFGHNLGLPDEYKLDGYGNRVPLVTAASFMGEPGSPIRSQEQLNALRLAMDSGDSRVEALQIDKLIRYLRDLAAKKPVSNAPPVDSLIAAHRFKRA